MTAVILKDLELSLLISVVAKRCIAFSRRMNTHPHTKWIDELKVTNPIQNNLFILQKGLKIFYCGKKSASFHFEFVMSFVDFLLTEGVLS